MSRLFAVVLLAAFATSTADAASIFSSIVRSGPVGVGTLNEIEDRNAEYIVKRPGGDMTRFEVGDTVEMYLQWESITTDDGFYFGTGLAAAEAGGAGYRLYARGSLEVLDITNVSTVDGVMVGDFHFGGEIAFFEATNGQDLLGTTSISAADSVLAGLDEFMRIGTSGAFDFITAAGAPIRFEDIPANQSQAINADFGLSLISGGDGIQLMRNAEQSVNGTFHDFVGSTQSFAVPSNINTAIGAGDDVFDLRTNTNIQFRSQVPEPGALAIWGMLAVAGLAYSRRQSRNKAATVTT